MSLVSISGIESKVAEGALASTLIGLSGGGLESVSKPYSKIAHEIVAEVRELLSIGSDDDSFESLQKIRKFISGEIDKALFAGIDRQSVREKLGQTGQLPTSGYDINYAKTLRNVLKEDRSFIEKAILTADQIEHIDHDFSNPKRVDSRGSSLYAKFIKAAGRKKSYYYLVDCVRSKSELTALRAWRIFPEVVDIANAVTPLDLLRAFTGHYGFEVEYKGFARAKLIVNLHLPVEFAGPEETDKIQIIHDEGGDSLACETGAAVTTTENDAVVGGETVINLAYAIDISRYLKDKLMRG